jgi:PhnB protein
MVTLERERASNSKVQISVMLAVEDARAALGWYKRAVGATELWNLGSAVGMEIDGAPFFLGQSERNGWKTPAKLGVPSAWIEVFCDDPDALIAWALEAGAAGNLDRICNHQVPWGHIAREASSIRSGTSGWLVIGRR